MPTINLKLRDGTIKKTTCVPMTVMVGNQAHNLALHKTPTGEWAVSDPRTGGSVLRTITAYFQGCPVSSKGLTKAQALEFAIADVELLAQRVGKDKFNKIMANGVLK